MPNDNKEGSGLYRAAVTLGNDKTPVGLTGGSMTKDEAEQRAKHEEEEYRKLRYDAKGVILPDEHPAKWQKNQNVGH